MNIKAKVISREMIKPSTPTPDHLRHYQFSFLDQSVPHFYISLIYFYQFDDDKLINPVQLIKSSLSNVLTKYYPLAGRINNNNNRYMDCNDEGVAFSEAKVSCKLSEIINEPEFPSEFIKFLPFDQEKDFASVKDLASAIQVNIFECGSIAIAVSISHKIADALSLIMFTKNWAATARGDGENVRPEFVAVSLFPPKDIGCCTWGLDVLNRIGKKIVLKKFLFEGSKIADLRDKYGGTIYPTRVEALSAFLWSRFTASTKTEVIPERPYVLAHTVNLRKRMEPPLSEYSFGNFVASTKSFLAENIDNNQLLVSKFRDDIGKIDKDYVKSMQDGCLELVDVSLYDFLFSSFCRFPVYEADFGWGKPVWVAWGGVPLKNIVYFIDMKDRDGIEVWVLLEERDMAKFGSDMELLAYVSASY